jgi:DNA topoisomerase-1
VDREGRPRPTEETEVACPICGAPMIKRRGRFGTFLGCSRYGDETNPCSGILNLDKKSGKVVAPSRPPLRVESLHCPKCSSAMNLRTGVRGPWLGCSTFPKCRGRLAWTKLEAKQRGALETELAAHDAAHPIPIIRTLDGRPLTDSSGRALPDATAPGSRAADPQPEEALMD